jgi:tetratricopeptide (TPR) repeat protein
MDGAISEFRQSLSLSPTQIQVMLRMAFALEKKGEWAGAIDQYRKASQADASIDLRGKVIRGDDRNPQREYQDAQQRLHAHVAALKAAGKSSEATDLATRIHAMEAAPGLSQQIDAAIQAGEADNQQRRFDEAILNFKHAVELADKLQPHDQRLATALDHLGKCYMGQDWNAAQVALERELKVTEELYGPASFNLTGPLQSLGMNALFQGDYATAKSFLSRATELNSKIFGENSNKVADSLMVEANVYLKQKDYEKAEPYFLRAVNIYQATFGQDAVDLLVPLSGLCNIYDGWGKAEKAVPCQKRLLTVAEKRFGPDSPVLVSVLTTEAKELRTLGRADEATGVEQRIQAIQRTTSTTLN